MIEERASIRSSRVHYSISDNVTEAATCKIDALSCQKANDRLRFFERFCHLTYIMLHMKKNMNLGQPSIQKSSLMDLSKCFWSRLLCVFLLMMTSVAWAKIEYNSYAIGSALTASQLPAHHLPLTANDICASCHINNNWLISKIDHSALSGTCVSCHNNIFSGGKHEMHLVTQGSCEACHATNTWEQIANFDHQLVTGTCISCHDGTRMIGKSIDHLVTSNNCDACHTTTMWTMVQVVNHDEIHGACESCHNGSSATGLSSDHMVTFDSCNACHETFAWTTLTNNAVIAMGRDPITSQRSKALASRAFGFDHAANNATTNCGQSSCHDGASGSTGKNLGHVNSTNVCDTCHLSTLSWRLVAIDHQQVVGQCADCHNTAIAVVPSAVTTKPNNHISSTDTCEACHSPQVWKPVRFVDHDQVLGTCLSCHDGTVSPGKQDISVGKPVHILSSEVCDTCHTTFTFSPTQRINHNEVQGTCESCHGENEYGALFGNKTVNHLVSSEACGACHTTKSWLAGSKVDHNQVDTANCTTCHAPAPEGIATPKTANHIPTSDACGTCHNTTIWRVVAFVDHNEILGACFDCHTGSIAKGKSKNHVPTNDKCEACHTSSSWAPLLGTGYDHQQNQDGVVCSFCHNNGLALGKNATHIQTIAECDTCHKIEAWGGVTPAQIHSNLTQPCVSCHNGSVSTGKGFGHIESSDACDSCHVTITWTTRDVDHTQVANSPNDCVSCHDNTIASGKTLGVHILSTDVCGACHTTAVWVPDKSVDHQEVLGTCVSCHTDGADSGGKNDGPKQSHINTSDICDTCHSTVAWVPARFVEHNDVQGDCIACHDGTIAGGKEIALTPHIETSDACGACHSTLRWLPATSVDHTEILIDCLQCHDGSGSITQNGKSSDHIDTSDNCGACHLTTVWTQTPGFNHDETTNLKPCETCHEGQTASGLPGFHIPTTGQCEHCHSPKGWQVLNTFINHEGVSAECSSCHNGTTVTTGKSAQHIPSKSECQMCHVVTPGIGRSGVTWLDVQSADVNHDFVLGRCFTCHRPNGPAITKKSADHIASGDDCSLCHVTAPQLWTGIVSSAVDHGAGGVIGACESCHDGNIAIGKNDGPNATHINSTNVCGECHEPPPTPAWTVISTLVDHTQVIGIENCAGNCHNGEIAVGKLTGPSAFHITSSDECAACHSTNRFVPAVRVDHSEVSLPCEECHAVTLTNNLAQGKFDGDTGVHIESSDKCNACHSTIQFIPAIFVDHDEVTGIESCGLNCHNGIIAIGKEGKVGGPTNFHITTSEACEQCHTTQTFIPAAVVDHNEITLACTECHDGSGAKAQSYKSNLHIATTEVCDACHDTFQWMPATDVDHLEVLALEVCEACHDGVAAVGKTSGHIPTKDQCGVCHLPKPTPWSSVLVVDHGLVIGTCEACHNGALAIGKNDEHIITTESCAACHLIYPTPFAEVFKVDHNEVIGIDSCGDNCHNDVVAIGKLGGPTGTHITTSDFCGACHNTQQFVPVTVVDHNEIFIACQDCHGDAVGLAPGRTSGPSGIHIESHQTCDSCHDTTTWETVRVDHSAIDIAFCTQCHIDGGSGGGKNEGSQPHMPTTDICESCHSKQSWIPAVNVDHNEVVVECIECHVAGGFSNINMGTNHMPTTTDCGACHSTSVFVPQIAVDHDYVNAPTCVTCHNGFFALSKLDGPSRSHISTTDLCDACHVTDTFIPVKRVDHNEVNISIDCGTSCHNGQIATGKHATHILTTENCDPCHTTTSWAPDTMDHNEAIGTCESAGCHNPPSTHSAVNVISDCGSCHSTTTWLDPINQLPAPAALF